MGVAHEVPAHRQRTGSGALQRFMSRTDSLADAWAGPPPSRARTGPGDREPSCSAAIARRLALPCRMSASTRRQVR